VEAFAPGRANLIGEHTDYNGGLALPFAVSSGVTVRVTDGQGRPPAGAERFLEGVVHELGVTGDRGVEISSDLPQGAGLSSSAALTLALALALGADPSDPLALAQLAQRVENEWTGADTGLLDQLAILLGREGEAVLVDFAALEWRHVPLELGDWKLVTLDSGASHSNAEGGYNKRRAECREAASRIGISSLSEASAEAVASLPAPLYLRAEHVLRENQRVRAAVRALEGGDFDSLGGLLDASHASLRDLYDASVPEVEATVARAKEAGAVGARMMGGGFGGVVLALYPPDATPPPDAARVSPSAGARVTAR
jgi:galactokinase